MTKVYRQIEDVKLTNNTILTIGTFDGVHLGHKKILNQLLQKKQDTGFETFVFTFDPHPRKVLFPEQTDLKLITETETHLLSLHFPFFSTSCIGRATNSRSSQGCWVHVLLLFFLSFSSPALLALR